MYYFNHSKIKKNIYILVLVEDCMYIIMYNLN